MENYVVIDFLKEASPLVDKSEKLGFNDSVNHPYVNMHPANYGVYKTGDNSQLVCYIPTHLEDEELEAKVICTALNKLYGN